MGPSSSLVATARRVARDLSDALSAKFHGSPFDSKRLVVLRSDARRLSRALALPGLEYLANGEMLCGCGVCTGIADLERQAAR